MLRRSGVHLARGPKVNGQRPAVDVLFRSAARVFGAGVVGVVLSGGLTDGTSGLSEIKRRGGRAVVQADALHHGMPTSAIENVDVDAVVTLREIPATLAMMVSEIDPAVEAVGDTPGEREPPGPGAEPELEVDVATSGADEVGDLTPYRCPECGGALWEIDDGSLGGFVCHVGHAFSADSILALQDDDTERALWHAVRLLEEQAAMNERLVSRLGAHGSARSTSRLRDRSRQALRDADVIRGMLEEAGDLAADKRHDEAT
jgi:two-component system chemotaxis response regulator CheB